MVNVFFKMKMGNVAVTVTLAIAMAMMVMGGSVLPELESQRDAFCDRMTGGDAPSVMQDLLLNTGQCCQTKSICSVVQTAGNAAVSICGTLPGTQFCVSCADAGNYANEVLAQCAEDNLVQGSYDPDGSFSRISQLYYITSTSQLPGQ